MRREWRTGWLLLLLTSGIGSALADDEAHASFGDDRFAAGEYIRLSQDVAGDAFIAAGRSYLEGRVGGDAVITGGEVEVRGSVGDDLYAAGGEVRIEATVDGNTRAAGANVRVTRGANLRGSASLAGGRVEVAGQVGRSLQAFGEHIDINGRIAGDVQLTGEDIRIGPDAWIGGRVTYRSRNEMQVDPRARIEGGIERRPRRIKEWGRGLGEVAWGFGRVLFFLGVLVLGALFVLAAPEFSRQAPATIRSDMLASLGLGLAMVVAVPFAAVLMMVTIIGIPVGLSVLAGYALLLMLGYLVGALFLGDLALMRAGESRAASRGWRIVFLLLALVVLALLRRVPAVGGLAVLLVFLAGVGALTLRTWREWQRPPGMAAIS